MKNTKEKYELTWVGKNASKTQAASPVNKKFVTDTEGFINHGNTGNILIEGDNLDGLKLLKENYLGKINMIYIDPPYNTGKDFVYRDNLKHSDWYSMMYPRLILAHELLSDDGTIFISIDDNELFGLKLICDEIFGEENFVNCIAVKMSEPTGVKMNHQFKRFPKLKEYILFYKKEKFNGFKCIDKYKQEIWDRENNIFLENMTKELRNTINQYKQNKNIQSDDINRINKLLKNIKKIPLSDKLKELKIPKTKQNEWLFENSYRIIKTAGSTALEKVVRQISPLPKQEIASALSKDNVLFFYITDYNKTTRDPRLRVIFADENIYKNPCDFWQDIKTSGSISNEGGIIYKNGKKPLKLLKRIIKMTTGNNDIILDFFAGSGSTGHAVMEQNAEDNLNRKFILIQSQENLDDNLKTGKAETKADISNLIKLLDELKKPHFITEITKERLKRSGKEVLTKNKNTDVSFNILKIVDNKRN